ncbi:MAG: hypothetical protein R3A80_04020 [Bdellovibrionota bacterium]
MNFMKMFNDVADIFLNFLKAPTVFLKKPFKRKSKLLFVYAGLIFLTIGFLGMGLSIIDGVNNAGAFFVAILHGSLVAYAHLLLLGFLIYLFFKHALKAKMSHEDWVSTFFVASVPFWFLCVVLNFVTRAVMAFTQSGYAVIFYSFLILEVVRFASFTYVLRLRFPKHKKNYLVWSVLFLIFFVVSYPKLSESYSMMSFDLSSLPMP